jgi:NifB/MoaA-like Fe-S oxidoreductase
MNKNDGGKITEVRPGSIGASLGLQPGDILLRMNHRPLLDVIDYLMFDSETHLSVTVLKKTGVIVELDFEKEAEDSLGLSFEAAVFDGIRSCSNHCLFCFVH